LVFILTEPIWHLNRSAVVSSAKQHTYPEVPASVLEEAAPHQQQQWHSCRDFGTIIIVTTPTAFLIEASSSHDSIRLYLQVTLKNLKDVILQHQ
jgi:hypothetical protein